jgi:hypothetical protein
MDPINTITGPLDSGSFADDATAIGTKVLAEITQLISKTNEVIGALTEVATDLDTEEGARAAADTAMDVRVDAAEASIVLLQTGFSDHTALLQAYEARIEDLEYATAVGYVEVASGDLTLANDTAHTVNFTGTAGLQSLTLDNVLTSFEPGKSWRIVCNNADGVQVASSAFAHAGLTSGASYINLLVGDIVDVCVVDIGSTKGWSAAIMRGPGGYRAGGAGGGDLGGTDQDDRIIWVDRTGDTGTRDLAMPNLAGTDNFNHHREITVVLYGTPSSGTFVLTCLGSDTFLDGATTFTMTEKSACKFIGNGVAGRWAAIVGGAM